MRDHTKTEIKKMLNADIVEPATTEWVSPVVFAPKKTVPDGYA